ncbi:LysR family transcriptional regulator [Bradyrhizobium prioriisuperbiae]|uniref:LysR family transcriptional regulator n=1 Tax=Bradyrhizobium prioriisuperbiae TaxID=2854389 RepID=UPI0028E9DCFD|nr:LysR family transcriptional regulator [Bradyrhizobium prioritasuperba]
MNDQSDSRNTLCQRRSAKIDLQHLHCAVAAGDCGSFRGAAEALLMRQSTLSRRIRQLEQAVGVILFDRSSGGVRATEAGRNFLRNARSILEEMDALVSNARSAEHGEAGRLTVGFSTSLSAGNLRATLTDFKQRFPQIELGMAERSRARLITALRNGALDIAIVTGDAPILDNRARSLWSERTLVALPEGHSLANREAVYWTDLRSETVLVSHRDLGREFENMLMSKLGSPEDRPRIERHDVSRGIIDRLQGRK